MGPFAQGFKQGKQRLILELHEMIRVWHIVSCVICFFFILCARFVGRSVQSYEKKSFFRVFSRLGPFPQVFRQVKEWLILELHEMIRVSLVVASLIVFILFCDWDGQGGMFKVMENYHFLNMFSRLGSFLELFGRVKEWLILE